MQILRDILSNPMWGGLGVIATILIGLIGFYLTDRKRVWLILAGLLAAFLAGLFLGAWLLISQPEENTYSVQISSKDSYPFSITNIRIHEGDDVEIIVENPDSSWSCGLDLVSPYGHVNDKRNENYLPSANLCELIGHVGDSPLFRVGAYTRFTSKSSGDLYLGSNDAKECSIRTNCYDDNAGALVVSIIVRRH